MTAVHLLEETQALLYRTVAVRAVGTRLGRGALLLGDLLGGLLIDVGTALLDAPYGEVPEVLEIVGCIENLAPLEAQPLDILLDGLYIFHILFLRVGIVHAEVAHAPILGSHTEVHGDGLGVTDVQVAVRLWRETRLQTAAVLAFGQVFFDDLLDEVQTFLLNTFICIQLSHVCSF